MNNPNIVLRMDKAIVGFSDGKPIGFSRGSNVGFSQGDSSPMPKKAPPSYGPAVKEFQETLQIRPRVNPSGTSTVLPFALSVSVDDTTLNWQVSSIYSTITDGTNGDNMEITGLDTDTEFMEDKWIVVEGVVTSLAVTELTVTAVDDPDEVSFAGDPEEQNKIRLLIGKVSIVDDAPVAKQFLFHSSRLTYGFLNGKLVRVFELAPTHKDGTAAVP